MSKERDSKKRVAFIQHVGRNGVSVLRRKQWNWRNTLTLFRTTSSTGGGWGTGTSLRITCRYNGYASCCTLSRTSGRHIVFEEMPTLEEDGVPFNEWLVPARNNIQRQLLRLQRVLGSPTTAGAEIPKSSHRDSIPFLLDLMVGVGFSLWRAVFQAGQATDRHNHAERARIFLNEIIRNNAAVYSTELNSWSLSYYLGNARFRLLELHKFHAHNEETAELDKLMSTFGDSVRTHVWDAPGDWIRCFHAMRLMLDILEKH
jgi:hypothetical protein